MYLGIDTKGIEIYNPYFFLVLNQVDYNKDKDLSESSYNYSCCSSATSAASELSSMNLLVLP